MKKILFTDALTEAVISGKKTVTRRIAKPISENIDKMRYGVLRRGANPQKDGRTIYSIAGTIYRPAFKVGDIVAVAQKYKDFRWPAPQRSDFQKILHSAGWNNKMFVRADLMPHRIRITNVRIERLQAIQKEDCLKEGITTNGVLHYVDGEGIDPHPDARSAFRTLINRTCGSGTWERNPWVWVYDFELVK